MIDYLNELEKKLEKTLESKLKKGNKKLFFVGLGLGLILTSAASVIAVSTIGNHDHFISQILGSDKERINLDAHKLNAIDCVSAQEQSTDPASGITGVFANGCFKRHVVSGDTNFVRHSAANNLTYVYEDQVTGRKWSTEFGTADQTLAQMITNCDNATMGGYTDWKVPTWQDYQAAIAHGLFEALSATDENGDGTLGDEVDFLWATTTRPFNELATSVLALDIRSMNASSATKTASTMGGLCIR